MAEVQRHFQHRIGYIVPSRGHNLRYRSISLINAIKEVLGVGAHMGGIPVGSSGDGIKQPRGSVGACQESGVSIPPALNYGTRDIRTRADPMSFIR